MFCLVEKVGQLSRSRVFQKNSSAQEFGSLRSFSDFISHKLPVLLFPQRSLFQFAYALQECSQERDFLTLGLRLRLRLLRQEVSRNENAF